MLEVAIEAAKEAGKVLANYFEMTGLERELKDDKSFVTKADRESEAIIVERIRRAFPDHGILGEEGADVNPGAEYMWIIDPVDGTANFVNGIPIFGISIAVAKDNQTVAAVVYNPVTNSLYAAEKGKGVTYNGKTVAVSSQQADAGVLTLAGISSEDKDRVRRLFSISNKHFKSTRILGCCAVELGYVARGGTEAFICLSHKPWDYAAGQLLVTEAGGRITDLAGNPCDLTARSFIASNGATHGAVEALMAAVPA